MIRESKEGDELVIMFSGHGGHNESRTFMFAGVDEKGKDNYISDRELQRAISHRPDGVSLSI
ncbi:hypothetical protein A2U01_0046940 [Trifolium medium]|uniref:Uncharacterized protein n=1 Tax=Trifolium medium TaxID=97028 RepID=A0A392QP70_9FABA|nr:hypothetical protein [Trifolium medium]